MTDLAHELDDHLASIGPAGSTGFEVTNLSSAAWAAQVIARNDRRLRDAERVMNERIAAVTGWFEQEKKRCDTGFLRESLVRYHRQFVAQQIASGVAPGKVQKRIPLTDGVTLERRPAKGSVVVVDVDALPPSCVTYHPAAVKSKIRELIDAGEDVPGATLSLPPEADDDGFTWTVRLKHEEAE
jgi:hypothetical protein